MSVGKVLEAISHLKWLMLCWEYYENLITTPKIKTTESHVVTGHIMTRSIKFQS